MAYLPGGYQPTWNFGQQAGMGFPQQISGIPQAEEQGLKWVDGEAAAKAYQLPAGLPPNKPIALWDTNDTIIYLKSVNQMGMPNPLQRVHYQLEERIPKHSGAAGREDYTEQSWDEEKINKFTMEIQELRDEIEALKKRGGKE
jgi:hypothetical protein